MIYHLLNSLTHSSIIDMMRQTDITNATVRTFVNKRLDRAMEYVSRFNIRIIHRSGTDHTIPAF